MVVVEVEKTVLMVKMVQMVVERLLVHLVHLAVVVLVEVMVVAVVQGLMVVQDLMVLQVHQVHLVCKEPHSNRELQYKIEQLIKIGVLVVGDLVGGLVVVVDKFKVGHHLKQQVVDKQGQLHSIK